MSTRRDFLAGTAGAGAGLVLAMQLPERAAEASPRRRVEAGRFAPNAWLRVAPDGETTVLIHKSEMGQGVMTSLAMIVAEELDADWTKVRAENGLPVKDYVMPGDFGQQFTGGSTSTRKSWTILAEAGAAARAMLVEAAARGWGVPASACRVENGVVSTEGKPPRSYGELAMDAAMLPVPKHVHRKDPKDYTLIGHDTARLDVPEKVDGSAVFAIDVGAPRPAGGDATAAGTAAPRAGEIPPNFGPAGVLTAVVLRAPAFGGTLSSFDGKEALAVPGVKHVVKISTGVAVVAEGMWPAIKGRNLVKASWNAGPNARVDSAGVFQDFEAQAKKRRGSRVRHDGNAKKSLAGAAKRLDAVYQLPYLAHAPMEPLSAVADVREASCEVWAGTQSQTLSERVAHKVTGLPKQAIRIHTTLLGGGFGRRGNVDFVQEAVEVSHAIRKPVKLVFTRDDEIQHDFYRPASWHRLEGGLDANGKAVAWRHHFACPSIVENYLPLLMKFMDDPTSSEGARDLPYAIPGLEVTLVKTHSPAPIGFWRSVGNSIHGFVTESFVDEMAHEAGADPLAFRLDLLSKAPRHKAALALAAEKAGWGSPLPPGHFRGLAVAKSFESYVAEVAEVSVEPDGNVKVHRVTVAIDCGRIVNPDTIKAQMMSGVIFGLSAALYGNITLKNGGVEQSNFHDYRVVRMHEAPVVDAHIVPSDEGPGGVGEPGVPPLAAAVTNAVFAATGVRIRTLPIDPALLAGKAKPA